MGRKFTRFHSNNGEMLFQSDAPPGCPSGVQVSEFRLVNVKTMFKEIIIEINVEDMGILSRVLCGHSNLTYHQNRIQLSYDTVYDYCEDKNVYKTAEHILTKCPKFSAA